MNRDPVCGMDVKETSSHHMQYHEQVWHFCSEKCLHKFEEKPEQYTVDPVCHMFVKPKSTHRANYADKAYRFCSEKCHAKFKATPETYVGKHEDCDHQTATGVEQAQGSGKYTCPMHPEVISDKPSSCPKCGMALERMGAPVNHETTEYVCPMHPEIVRDKPGPCPKCGMALEARTVSAEEDNTELDDMSRRLKVSAALSIPVFILAMVADLAPSWLPSGLHMSTVQWIEFVLATPVVLWGGWPFFVRFVASIKTWN
ncbi:MAG: YHS domain-containing protein, partial [Ghiorsea sp.]|nr:YHS domain-containing protein [Ghiorsea sp.]